MPKQQKTQNKIPVLTPMGQLPIKQTLEAQARAYEISDQQLYDMITAAVAGGLANEIRCGRCHASEVKRLTDLIVTQII